MRLISSIIQPLHHCEDSTLFLLKSLGVSTTHSSLQKELTEHPNYPSLLAISDVIGTYGVRNIAVKLEREEWDSNLETPFLAHINSSKLQHNLFSVITEFSDTEIKMYNPETRKISRIGNEEFVREHYRGTVMAFEADETSGEKGFLENQKKEKKENSLYLLLSFIIPFLTILTCIVFVYSNPTAGAWPQIVFTILSLAGVITGSLIFWHEIDEYNPIIKQICQSGKRINCSAVLNSKGAKFLGLSWSNIGLSYFMGLLILLVCGGLYSLPMMTLLGWISILALPYVIFSIYYQWRIAKQWCIMCIIVQCILVAQFATTIIGGFFNLTTISSLPLHAWVTFAGVFMIPFLFISLLVPSLKKAKSFRLNNIELQRLKHNPKIFEALISKQRSIQSSTQGLGITLGNPNGKHKIIKVCNPYCEPCAKAHSVIDSILESNSDISVQIIFMVTDKIEDLRRLPVLHFLSIAKQNNATLTKEVLDNWYNQPIKNYDDFSKKYPLDGDLTEQSEKLIAMDQWCTINQISHTPTIFIDGYEKPDIYTVSDLKFFLHS